MKELSYVIKNEIGIHARPAGMLTKLIKEAKSTVLIECNGKKADAKNLFALLSLAVKHNDKINIKIEGEDEDETLEKVLTYLTENL